MILQRRGFIVAAPSSGSGKTTITLGLLRAFRNRGLAIRSAKSGPDYIDPRFHQAASGAPCVNVDAWAMTPERIAQLTDTDSPLIIEGAMGLFDGAPPDGKGATADVAHQLAMPVVLVVDAARMAQSIAPLIEGFTRHDPDVRISGVILNRVGSARHEAMLRAALAPIGLAVFGAVPRTADIVHPSRHLGLVQAQERPDLDSFLDRVAEIVAETIDLDALASLTFEAAPRSASKVLPPPAQRIALAQDAAFAFAYPHILNDWSAAGAEILPFSPLADEAAPDADLIYLPGGYPELHAARLAQNTTFLNSLRNAPEQVEIYGECGGYMVMGKGLTDAVGTRHEMLGLLDLETSFAKRKLHLGYRDLTALGGPFPGQWAAHEFHYATTLRAVGPPLFKAQTAEGTQLPDMGLRSGRACGSFAHLIDQRLPV